jgi:hypothetical protein
MSRAPSVGCAGSSPVNGGAPTPGWSSPAKRGRGTAEGGGGGVRYTTEVTSGMEARRV